MTDNSSDTPGVIIFPPLIPLSILIVGIILNLVMPLDLLTHVPLLGRMVVGILAVVVGLGTVIGANRIFRHIGTNVRPSLPALALGTTGPFAWTRNPMYVGGGVMLLGIAIACALDWVILLLVLSLPLVHYGIVLREERYLERKFGDEYLRYRKKVPRYWWRF
ncbi:MAG: isoprenylcysteine carboxylmethyltransferase family protein [Verrucomicrobia bacterium]|nr:isoprenylcysteine carboxylmethyltransferase family protein [Verrucomicrobiota bacterium]MBV8376824.1 isoprenylcysteine carboxylmethyltransferase family protein [Verrucomicrobiota bacterium]